MYEAFDKFPVVPTWHTTHDLDGERFYRALHQVVKDDAFSPDAMADYMRQKLGVPRGGANNYSDKAIQRYTAAAWAVRDYLAATARSSVKAGRR
jgi:hypothetical protein